MERVSKLREIVLLFSLWIAAPSSLAGTRAVPSPPAGRQAKVHTAVHTDGFRDLDSFYTRLTDGGSGYISLPELRALSVSRSFTNGYVTFSASEGRVFSVLPPIGPAFGGFSDDV